MTTLIIEDERRAANRLIKLIESYDATIEVIGRIDTVKNAIEWFNAHKAPDLVFMDIQLADGLCFDIFDETDLSVPIIFTTAYDSFALKAFQVNSIDYLLKPIGFKEFKAGMDKFYFLKNQFSLNKEQLSDARLIVNKSYKSRFVVKLGDHLHSIRVEDIVCFMSRDKTSYIHTSDGKKYIADYTLGHIEHLISPTQFYRINRSCIINIDGIVDIISYSNSRLKILLSNYQDDTDEVVVSREKVQDFKNWLDR